MFRRSLASLSKPAERTIVRDPRKKRVPAVVHDQPVERMPLPPSQHPRPLPFEPSSQNQQSVGSSLASYVLAGAGVAIGFTIVGAIFGGF